MTDPFSPLRGIRVVEVSHMIMGPSCGMFLGMLGAEVVKVEPPEGDKTRDLTGMGRPFFPLFNRGKKSVQLDLQAEAGTALPLSTRCWRRQMCSWTIFAMRRWTKMGADPDDLRRRATPG